MSKLRSLLLLTSGLLLCTWPLESSGAQIVRRFTGGGVQVNAPFVRVNVGPGGTSVRAPFTAVDRGRVFIGRRRRLLAQPQYAAPTQRPTPQPAPVEQTPEVADVDALPYPTESQLAVMDDTALIETLREMMARFHYRLSRLKTGEGWQDYLILSREVLGSPGSPAATAQFDKIAEVLPRYQSVADNPEFAKIYGLPSFVASFAALREADRRAVNFQPSGPAITDPNRTDPNDNGPTGNDRNRANEAEPRQVEPAEQEEILPTPQPTAVVPNETQGERSILKRK
ncbi:MAG: hypothetical protein AAGD11_11125 [Planctomycetota bacterium]